MGLLLWNAVFEDEAIRSIVEGKKNCCGIFLDSVTRTEDEARSGAIRMNPHLSRTSASHYFPSLGRKFQHSCFSAIVGESTNRDGVPPKCCRHTAGRSNI